MKASTIFLKATEKQCPSNYAENLKETGLRFCAMGLLCYKEGKLELPAECRSTYPMGDSEEEVVKKYFGDHGYSGEYECPACGMTEIGIREIIVHYNNEHAIDFKDVGYFTQSLGF